uniref:Uncharacterized protein n=1 Tax=Anopheles funestus TaxID=62324 RepID=A0A182RZT5_ANOFN
MGTGLQNGSASSGASSGESTSSRFNRSWTDFTTKLGATTKPILAASTTSLTSSLLDAGGRALQASLSKSRRSITPSKEQQQSSIGMDVLPNSAGSSSSSSNNSGNSGATKDRTKSPSSISETESKCAKNGPFGVKTAPSSASTSDLTGVLESNSTTSKQHHHTSSCSSSSLSSSSSASSSSSVAATEEPTAEDRHISSTVSLSLSSPSSSSSSSSSASSSSSSSASTTSSSSSSPSPTSKQQHHHHHHQPQHNHQSKQQSATTTATTKTNVKKTKSLPVSYESVVVSLASVFAATSTLSRTGTTTTTYTSQKPTAEVTTSTVVTSATVATPATKDVVPSVQISTKEIPSKLRTGPSIGTNGKQLVGVSNGTGTTKAAVVASNNKQQESSVTSVKPGGDKTNLFSGATGSTDSGGKENSSSGNIISQEKLTSGNGNAQVESSLQHQHQQQLSQTKKFSKTPGRERKPNQSKKGTNGKGASAGGAQHYKGTALQFNTPAQQQHKSTTLGTILQNASVPGTVVECCCCCYGLG